MTTIPSVNPATKATLATYQTDNKETIRAKVIRARKANASWSQTSLSERIQLITQFASLLRQNTEQCAIDLARETGKPISQAKGEVKATQGRLDFFMKAAPSVMQPRVLAGHDSGTAEEIRFEPLGTVANISAWNYPYFVGTNVIIPALLMGNTVLYKPSELALQTGHHLTRLLHEAGVPQDVFQMVIGGGEQGAELIEENVDGVFFTGSYPTGKKIAEAVAGRMIKVQLELGGKDPAYICEDVNVEKVAKQIVEGTLYNAGQSCCAIERVYVAASIYEAFCEAFVAEAKKWRPGDPEQQTTKLGPLTRPEQMAVLDSQVKDALDKGAHLLLKGGCTDGPGSFYEPVVLGNVNHEMLLMKDESFGPIVGLQSVGSDDEALALMQDTPYGLTASVYTENADRAEQLLRQINSGTVYWNCSDRVSPQLPWSGRGHSGIGLTCSVAGIETFLRPKAWHLRRP